MNQESNIILSHKFWRTLLNELFSSSPTNFPEPYQERMAHDFPEEMDFHQAYDEYYKNPEFWDQYYYDGLFDFSWYPDKEVPPDGNFARPVNRATRQALRQAVKKVVEAKGRAYARRMAHDFPDEMDRHQAFDEYTRAPDFWRDFYDGDPRNLSKGKEVPPDGNFAKPERTFRQTPLDDLIGR